jgi:hypothetical protein
VRERDSTQQLRMPLAAASASSIACSFIWRVSEMTRIIKASAAARAASAAGVAYASRRCQGQPPTSSVDQPGGGGARFGSDRSSIACRSSNDKAAISSGDRGGGGGGWNERCGERFWMRCGSGSRTPPSP